MIDPLVRGLPQSLEAERLVIAAAMDDPAQARRLAADLSHQEFSTSQHQLLWRTITELTAAQRTVTRVVVTEELVKRENLEAAGGFGYISALGGEWSRAMAVDEYVGIVRDTHMRRQILLKCQAITDACYTDTAEAALAEAESMVRSVGEQAADSKGSGLKHVSDVLADAGGVDGLFRPASHGLKFPWDDLNRLTLGMHPGQMLCLAGRSGKGKSAAAVQIAESAARQHAGSVAVFSLEMAGDANLRRMACASAGVDSNAVRNGRIGRDERRALADTTSRLVATDLWMSDRSHVTIPSIYRGLQFLSRRGDIALVVVDYLQLIGTDGKASNREREVAAVSRGLKVAAREFSAPLLVLVQYNREADQEGVRPSSRMIRESGAIWHDSDVGMLLHEPNGTDGEIGWETELIVEKQREGPTGFVRLFFEKSKTRFMPLDERG